MTLIQRAGVALAGWRTQPRWQFYLLAILCGYLFVLEVNYIGGYFLPPDMYRDFLVARNIALHGQLIMLGPWNGVFDSFASPVYNYLLAIPLLFSARLVVLSVVNIVWQLAGVLFLYIAGKKLFSATTGLVAVLLYVTQRSVLQQSLWVFQPFVMLPFLYAAYACLAVAYRDKKFSFLLLAGVLASVAGAIHNSALTALPVFLVAGYITIRQNAWGLSRFFIFCELTLATLVATYVPAFVVSYAMGLSPMHAIMRTVNMGIWQYLSTCWHLLTIVTNINSSLLSDDPHKGIFEGALPAFLALLVAFATVLFFASRRVMRVHKYTTLFFLAAAVVPIFCGAVLGVPMYARRFLLILGPVSVFLAAVFCLGFRHRVYSRLFACVCVGLLVYAFLYKPADFIFVPGGRVDRVTEPAVAESIASDVLSIRQLESADNFSFFQIYLYPDTPRENSWSNAQYWLAVEEVLERHTSAQKFNFTHNDDSEFGLGYRVTNKDAYVFVVCASYVIDPLTPRECLQSFQASHPQFGFMKITYSSRNYSVYLMKKLF